MNNIFSYIDPAATALIGQILAGVTITLGVVVGIWWRKISTAFKSLYAKLFGKKKTEVETEISNQELIDELDDKEAAEDAAEESAEEVAEEAAEEIEFVEVTEVEKE